MSRVIVRRYSRLAGTEGVRDCIYCGEPAEHIDHVLPVRYSNWREDLTDAERAQLVVVPACAECNGIAAARAFHSLAEKRDFIRERLRNRYAKTLAAPEWKADEIRTLGRGLRGYVGAGQARKTLIEYRLAHDGIPSGLDHFVPIGRVQVECAICGEVDWCNPLEWEGEIQPACGECWVAA